MHLFSINRSRGYDNPSLEIIVIEHCSTGGCPLEEAREHCSLNQSVIYVVVIISFMCYCGDYVGYITVILPFLSFYLCSAYFLYLVYYKNLVENIKKFHFQVQETVKKSHEKYKARHEQHRTERTFRVGDRVWLHLNKERIHSPGKNIKALQYGRLEVLEKVGDNAYILILPPYIQIYLVVNLDILKLYEPSMLDKEEEQVLPSIEDLAPDAQEELEEDIFFQKWYRDTRQGQHDL
jgi:hypothetical protein